MKYPCSVCLVQACCSVRCFDYYKFINYISDNMASTMTADEIHDYRMNTPLKVRKCIETCMKSNNRYAKAAKWHNYPSNVRWVRPHSNDAIK